MLRGVAVGAVFVVFAGTVLVPTAGAERRPSPHQQPAALKSVTLVSGDRVAVQGDQVTVVPGAGREQVLFHQRRTKDGHVHVVPQDAVRLVRTGRVDKRLFDVTTLIEQGRDDGSRDTLPLIVDRDSRAPAKSTLATTWEGIKSSGSKVWLDGRVRLLDAESFEQVGAPAAWRLGLTGRGVTVAVLDGGIDAAHPDLQGKVLEAKDFTGSGVRDTFGHGTHVAATVAGDGAFGGVAKESRLLVGKVCERDTCDESAVLAAMEWAAPRAEVVNLSLGGGATDGTDPLSLAVNRLSEQHGTLFVVAAGNDGQPGTVSAPAAADAALAVGSVGKADRLSGFSGRGPRVGDWAVKPDVVAPGEDIGAARAAGTSMGQPIDAVHTRADGTSMAAPHVAGAAALLKQAHPRWSGRELKAALTGAATSIGRGVYEEGSGRLDVAKAVAGPVVATVSSLNFGLLAFPHVQLPPITKKLTYRNVSAQPVTVPISVDHAAIKAGAERITVPGNGSADVEVTLDPAKVAAGSGGARITAGSSAVAIGFTAEPEMHELTVTTIGRDGKPSDAEVSALELDSGESQDFAQPVNGVVKLRLLKGNYSVDALVHGDHEHTWASTGKISLDKPTAITIDARQGKEVGARLDRKVGRKYVGVDAVYQAGGSRVQTGVSTRSQDALFAVPVKAGSGYFNFGTFQIWGADGHEYFVASPHEGGIPVELTPRVRDRELYTEKVRYRAQGSPAIGSRSSTPFYVKGQSITFGVVFDLPVPQRRVEHFTGRPDVKWVMDFFQRPLSQPSLGFDGHIGAGRPVFVAGRSGERSWNSVAATTDLNLRGFHGLVRYGNNGYVQHWPFAPGDAGASDEFIFGGPYVQARTRLSTVDGKVLADSAGVFANFRDLPDEPTRYVLDVEAQRSPKWTPFAPKATTRFTFSSSKTDDQVYLPVPTLRITGPFDDLNRVPAACRVFPVDISVTPQTGSDGAAAVKSVTVQASTDDGTTWRSVPVVGAKTRWKALVGHPEGAEFVSLKVKAVDAAGNSVEQITIRAYGINRSLG
ncbi:S8 family serine peptidase [Lentzea sp. PSKA42]|uniref:S8 family serine peptidase n=1 Tax=Lentzea indica TaxID=2604800 RepID=A0ABX1FH42_9PSEU|nr:S8 family serine peptidase [Lentzea indica]